MTAPRSPRGELDLATPQGRAAVDERIPAPAYDRTEIRVGIAHFGVGSFHRSHQAMYLDRLLTDGQAMDWGICGVDVMDTDRPKKHAFTAQDGLYTLVVKNPDGSTEPRVIGSIVRYLYAPDEPEQVLNVLADPQTKIVSLTITEGGYNVNQLTGEFDAQNPAVVADLAPGAGPRTVFGFVVEGLRRRLATGLPPFTVMSCDNIPGNGDVARAMFTAFAELKDPGTAALLRHHVAFPNSMVDRITPVTTPHDIEHLRADYGVKDAIPVVCEPFTQWVLQDTFPHGRPPWQDCGVQLVADVEPYELMKLRLLNAGHQALAYAGYLAGYRYVHEAASDPIFATFLLGYMQGEARPTLPPVPGVDLDDYIATLLERFANPAIRDTLARLAAFGSDRIPKWLIPVIRANLASGGEVTRSAAIVASWARYDEGTDESGQPIEVVDLLRDKLVASALQQSADPLTFVRNQRLFGDIADQRAFAVPYVRALESFRTAGALRTYAAINQSVPAQPE
jgi:mannitol 2-dehydrogenase